MSVARQRTESENENEDKQLPQVQDFAKSRQGNSHDKLSNSSAPSSSWRSVASEDDPSDDPVYMISS